MRLINYGHLSAKVFQDYIYKKCGLLTILFHREVNEAE